MHVFDDCSFDWCETNFWLVFLLVTNKLKPMTNLQGDEIPHRRSLRIPMILHILARMCLKMAFGCHSLRFSEIVVKKKDLICTQRHSLYGQTLVLRGFFYHHIYLWYNVFQVSRLIIINVLLTASIFSCELFVFVLGLTVAQKTKINLCFDKCNNNRENRRICGYEST